MTDATIKLTVRLPVQLHRALKERAVAYDVPLNQAVIDTLAVELHVAPTAEETEREQVNRVLREAGLLADTSWMSDLAKELLNGEEPVTLEEAREWLRGVPLSGWIIEDRGPQ